MAGRDRHDPGARDQAGGRLDANIGVGGRRAEDRPGGLSADGEGGQADGRGDARPGAGAAWRLGDVVGVDDLAAERAVAAGHAVGEVVRELGEVALRDDDGPGGAELLHQRGVRLRVRVRQRDRSRRGRHRRRVDVVLDQHRDAKQRAVGLTAAQAALELLVSRAGLLQGERVDHAHGVNRRALVAEDLDPL